MAVLNWREPIIQICKLDADGKPDKNWRTFPEAVKDTARLNTEPGNETVAEDEGGGIVDSFRLKSKYVFEVTIFVKKGDEKLIDDVDGVIAENLAVRWAPKGSTLKGRQMLKTSVSVAETWSSNEGSRLKYSFTGLVPGGEKKILEEYQPATTPPPAGG